MGIQIMDPETGCGLPSTGEKTRLLIGRACWFRNSIGWILAAAVRALAWFKLQCTFEPAEQSQTGPNEAWSCSPNMQSHSQSFWLADRVVSSPFLSSFQFCPWIDSSLISNLCFLFTKIQPVLGLMWGTYREGDIWAVGEYALARYTTIKIMVIVNMYNN